MTSQPKQHSDLVQVTSSPKAVYWKSISELHGSCSTCGEFAEGVPATAVANTRERTRRDFLSGVGLATAFAGLTGCRAPVQYAEPAMTASDKVIPGVSRWYATTCGACASSCTLLVKQRDGRPIKVEGNDLSDLFGRGTCATGQAALLSLYDDERPRGPAWRNTPVCWQEIDQRIVPLLAAAQTQNRRIVLLTGTLTSPSTLALIGDFAKRFSGFSHVVYEPISTSAIRTANEECFGRAVIPHYRFGRARVVVGLEADFLGTWLSPVEFARDYAAAKKPEGEPHYHVQFESGVSVTGSNADLRIPVAPSDMGAIAAALLRRVAIGVGISAPPEVAALPVDSDTLDKVATTLVRHREKSIVVSGIQDQALQVVINGINSLLGNYASAIDLVAASHQHSGNDQALAELIEQMNGGEVHTLIIRGVNPAYDASDGGRFLDGLKKVALSISCSSRRDETTSHVDAICPDHHFLEAWGDAEPVDARLSLAQPLIAPLFNTRAFQDSLLEWSGAETDYYTYLRAFWANQVFPRQKTFAQFEPFWDRALQDGAVTLPEPARDGTPALRNNWKAAVQAIVERHTQATARRHDGAYELLLYESVAMRDGRSANNPWLQELPDPITKVTWGNYASISPRLAQTLQLVEGDIVALKLDSLEVQLPIFIQPGQEAQTIAVALGYGSTNGKVGRNVGVNAFPLARIVDGCRQYAAAGVMLRKTGSRELLAGTQTHFTMEGRPIALETSFDQLQATSSAGHERREPAPTLWPERPHGEHSWGMVIDVNACTGCSACVVACQAENNVPVVGKDQVRRTRIMHWIRIDHYYAGDEHSPRSLHQPMMCQHCGHAPCETVCPVLATTTSSEGLNQQVYNRCIGTRYCANNCPYKVRRFNFYGYSESADFDYTMQSPLARMALNPDVVVRTRGVMEKCSMCVQRIQSAKNAALQRGSKVLADGDIQMACQQACPTQAIVFGDTAAPNSRISQLRRNPRFYNVLDDLGTQPAVGYLKKVRNTLGA